MMTSPGPAAAPATHRAPGDGSTAGRDAVHDAREAGRPTAIGRGHATRARSANVHWSPPSGTLSRGTLAARSLGDTGPPVVLLHGLPSSGLFWGADYDALAEHARVVVPDLLGFGRSPRPTGGYGPDDHADAIAATLHALHVDDTPALVVGHSVGALIALRLAVRHPSLVAGVVGFGAPIYGDYAAARRHLANLGPVARLFGLDTRWAELACTWLCQRHRRTAARLAARLRPDLPRPLAADAVEHSWESFSETLARVLLPAEAVNWLDLIDVPVHLMVGGQDPVVDLPLLDELARRNPRLRLDVYPHAGHDLPLTDPVLCRTEIQHDLAASSTRRAA